MRNLAKHPEPLVVQLFSFQRDRIKKLAVPNWLHGLVRSKICWHFSLSDQEPFNSMGCAVANMTFKETRGLFLWFEEVISRQGFCFASEAARTFNVACIKYLCKTASYLKFLEWWAEWICNYHYHLCSLLRAELDDHLIPVSISQAATFALSPLALHSPFPAHSSFLSKPPPKGLGVSMHSHLHLCALSLPQPQVLSEEQGEGKSSDYSWWWY